MAIDDDVFVDNTPHIIDDDDVDTDKGDINIEDNTALPKKENKRKRAPQKKGQNVGIQWKWLWTKMERKPINLCVNIALKSLIPIHARKCKQNLDNIKGQNTIQFKKQPFGDGSTVTVWKHDEDRIKKAMLNLFVVGELPFKFVENEAFIEYTNALNGKVKIPSRHKISRDVAKFYVEERKKLLTFFANPHNMIHLTTDSWTSSCQKTNYMVVTGHFIDDDWVMHKRILNFRPIDTHVGEDVGRLLLECIHEWGIKNVMTISVDNATTNDKALEFLTKKLPNLYEGGKHFHVRCVAHILNLIVKDGLKYHNSHVSCVQRAVKYIRHSTARIRKFKKCMKDSDLEGDKFLCGECPTRWNSTFELLKSALNLKYAFFEYEVKDTSFARDLSRVPQRTDFEVIEEMLSASSKPLVQTVLREIIDVDQHLETCSTKVHLCHMIPDMRAKYNKYWGSIENLNDFTCFAVLLDPQMKSIFLSAIIKKMIENTRTEENILLESTIKLNTMSTVREIEKRMENLFKTYEEKYANVGSSQKVKEVVSCDVGNDFLDAFLMGQGDTSATVENELRRYLNEPRVTFDKNFDILDWWKKNALRFPIVARMAKDILSIQVTTVASESVFSTCGRILDEYRTRLNTPIVEALVCTQDWVRKSRKPIIDDDEDILKDDGIALEIEAAMEEKEDRGNGKKPIEV
uniref:HAT C-terminal dimerisation domain-containing protein n=1 Tax=Lactuca sativa TaxID=4236 RepID=A0A9R1XFE7_LACSA|nr:hypothetical protein LSAT_V11C400199240 [Lactuca sativa]